MEKRKKRRMPCFWKRIRVVNTDGIEQLEVSMQKLQNGSVQHTARGPDPARQDLQCGLRRTFGQSET